MLRMITDRGTEYCGTREHHEYPLFMALKSIDHTKAKAISPQTNGICERFTILRYTKSSTNPLSSCRQMSING